MSNLTQDTVQDIKIENHYQIEARPSSPRSPWYLNAKFSLMIRNKQNFSALKHRGQHGLRGHKGIDRYIENFLPGPIMDVERKCYDIA